VLDDDVPEECPCCGGKARVYTVVSRESFEPKAFQEAVHLASQEFAELVIKKQMDYGSRNITDFGEYGILVRLNDKLQRLISLYDQGKEPENESVDDTWDDIGGYALVRKMLRRGWFELEMETQETTTDASCPITLTDGATSPKIKYVFPKTDPEDAMYG